jgi:hypothetical protein
MIITTSYRPTEKTMQTAETIASYFQSRFLKRKKKSVQQFIDEEKEDVLVIGNERFELYPLKGEKFFFHPGSSLFRAKRWLKGEEDPFLKAAALKKGETLLDCTLGLGSDAIIGSLAAGKEGTVIGLEKRPIPAFLVKTGLAAWETNVRDVNEAMKRIKVITADHLEFLRQLPDEAFDVVYFDPMFHQPIAESSGIAPLRLFAEYEFQSDSVKEAVRVAKKSVVLKDHWKSPRFHQFGFHVYQRKSSLFHFGVLSKAAINRSLPSQ